MGEISEESSDDRRGQMFVHGSQLASPPGTADFLDQRRQHLLEQSESAKMDRCDVQVLFETGAIEQFDGDQRLA